MIVGAIRDVWTEADAAELDVLVHALVVDYFEHRKRCLACQPDPRAGTPYPCPHLQRAIREVCDWREARILLSRSRSLRAAQDEAAT